jgi:uncharacterized protein (TIGR03000 family)
VVPGTKPEVTPPPVEKKKITDDQEARVRVRIDVPEDAKLYVDGQLMRSTSARRVFQTPTLQVGRVYFYDVRVEIERNGQTMSDAQRLIIRPGQEASLSFANLEQRAIASATARNTEE